MSTRTAVPDHVPAELVLDRNFAEYLGELDDPYLAAARLHEGPDILWVTEASNGKPAWIFTRHPLVEAGFADWQTFSSAPGPLRSGSKGKEDWLLLPVEADPPDHQVYRDVLRPFFTPQAINRRAGAVQALCDSLVNTFIEHGECEFVSQFASIFPNAIVLELMGMPREMLQQFVSWEEQLIHGASAGERGAAATAIIEYLRDFIAAQRRQPDCELMQSIIEGRFGDRRLDEREIFGLCYLLFVAGLDTVFSSLGWIMHHLARDQALQERLRRNPGEIPAAVEEFTRAFGVSAPNRTVARDMVFHGISMKQGEDVLLPTYLAGRDPLAFADPHRIDIDRRPRHVTFGRGRHLCLGIHLAKREMCVVIESFLSRTRELHMPESLPFAYHTTNTIGVDRLHLAWSRA